MKYLPILISLVLFLTTVSSVQAMVLPHEIYLDGLTFSHPLSIEDPEKAGIQLRRLEFGTMDTLMVKDYESSSVFVEKIIVPLPTLLTSTKAIPSEAPPEEKVAPTPTPTEIPTPTVTPTPTPQPVISSPQDIDGYFEKYSAEYHVDKDQLRRIAVCESGYNTQARNGIYGGMYQFGDTTWSVVRSRMGQDANPDLRFSAEESIKTAAFHIANGGQHAWPNCK